VKIIDCWRDLEPFGIDALTLEACGLMHRLLLDVTERGRKVVAKMLGVPGLKLPEPWNRGTKDDPHVGSIMLPHAMLATLCVFALLECGCTEAWLLKDGSVAGVERTDAPELVRRFLEVNKGNIVRRFAFGGTAGDRNEHAMTGRVE
jgi:hypothetical protein